MAETDDPAVAVAESGNWEEHHGWKASLQGGVPRRDPRRSRRKNCDYWRTESQNPWLGLLHTDEEIGILQQKVEERLICNETDSGANATNCAVATTRSAFWRKPTKLDAQFRSDWRRSKELSCKRNDVNSQSNSFSYKAQPTKTDDCLTRPKAGSRNLRPCVATAYTKHEALRRNKHTDP